MRLGISAVLTVTLILIPPFACSSPPTPCKTGPTCDDGRALNCDLQCVGSACNRVPFNHACGSGTHCQVRPGVLSSVPFFRDRALCRIDGSDACDAGAEGPPQCPAPGTVRGCSGYGVRVESPCAQAHFFFASAPCCAGSIGDAGAGDGGPPGDGGADGGA